MRELAYNSVKDSGNRETFSTGSRRDTRVGKGRFDLLPPLAIKRLAQLYENGATKYGSRNWEKGQYLSRYLDSALRHINNHLSGMVDEDHLIQAAWNLLSYVETEARIKKGILPMELNDMTHLEILNGNERTNKRITGRLNGREESSTRIYKEA